MASIALHACHVRPMLTGQADVCRLQLERYDKLSGTWLLNGQQHASVS